MQKKKGSSSHKDSKKMNNKRKICLLGSTGNGKSTTGNTLMGKNLFKISNDLSSCTGELSIVENENFIMMDTVGFGDNRTSKKEIIKMMHSISTEIINYTKDTNSPVMVNYFVMVLKATPRLTSIVQDLETMVSIFGTKSLKSLVLLIIQPLENKFSHEKIQSEIEKMEVVVDLYDAADTPIKFVLWDNYKPFKNQKMELMGICVKLPPFTHKIYQQALVEIEEKQKKLAEKYFGKELKKYENRLEEYKEEQKELENKLKNQEYENEEMKKEMENEKKRMIEKQKIMDERINKLNEEKQEQNKVIKEKMQAQLDQMIKMNQENQEKHEESMKLIKDQMKADKEKYESINSQLRDELDSKSNKWCQIF